MRSPAARAAAPAPPGGVDPFEVVSLTSTDFELVPDEAPTITPLAGEQTTLVMERTPARLTTLVMEPARRQVETTLVIEPPADPGAPLAPFETTLALSPAKAGAEVVAPFPIAAAGAGPIVHREIPGAPWAGELAPSAPVARSPFDETLALVGPVHQVVAGHDGRDPQTPGPHLHAPAVTPPSSPAMIPVIAAGALPLMTPPPLPAEEPLRAAVAPVVVDGDVGIARCAAIAAELGLRRSPRAAVLAAHGLAEPRWAAVERRWSTAIEHETRDGSRRLREIYDDAYAATWERIHGPLPPSDHARLLAAAEGGVLPQALEAAGIRATAWMCLRRAWARRVARDREHATIERG